MSFLPASGCLLGILDSKPFLLPVMGPGVPFAQNPKPSLGGKTFPSPTLGHPKSWLPPP